MLLKFADWLVYQVMGMDPAQTFSQAVNFFVYDAIKILLLLFAMIFAIGFLRTFLPQKKITRWLTARGAVGNIMASLFGAITPFCSCSSIPVLFGFLKAGIPLGAIFSFLITSPLINEYLVVLMFGFFGWKITALYVGSGMLIGVVSGIVLGRMRLEKWIVSDIIDPTNALPESEASRFTWNERWQFGWQEGISITKKLWIWVLVGVAAGAAIHNYVPQETIHQILDSAGMFSVPLATLIGVPLYGSCAAIVPIAVVLFQKGIPIGTAMAFMMGIVALSLPEAIMLRRAMKLKLIVIFFGVTTAAIILIGYLFNLLEPLLVT